MKFIDIPEDSQRQAINTVALKTGLSPSSIEKDWWVTQVLKAVHTLPYAEHIAFKGGTSLSKCWNLISRFSEDVDIALSREFPFLEKVFLLHEEFKKDVVRVERMSRHIYDLAMMMNSKEQIADHAIHNEALYRAVLEHRRKFIGLKGFNYDELYSDTLCIVPNEDIARLWQDDYKFMCEHMIYGQVPPFEELMNKLRILNDQIRQLNYQKQ